MRDGLSAIPVQPFSCFDTLRLLQERLQEHAINVLLSRPVLQWQFRRRTSKSRKRFVAGRRLAIFVGADNPAVEVKAFGQQRAIAQPDSVASAELAANGGDFHLELPRECFSISLQVPSPFFVVFLS